MVAFLKYACGICIALYTKEPGMAFTFKEFNERVEEKDDAEIDQNQRLGGCGARNDLAERFCFGGR